MKRLIMGGINKIKEATVDTKFKRKKTTCPNKMFDKDLRTINKSLLKLMLNYYRVY
jgi:hypothetical protein